MPTRRSPWLSPLSAADRPDQGFDLTANSDVIRTLHRPLLDNHDVDIPFANLDEFQREF